MALGLVLREMVDRLVEETLASPTGFDFEKLKSFQDPREMNYYALDNLPRLGCGIARCAYLLGPGKVLKIETKTDVSQNQSELEAFKKFGADFTPVIYDHDPEMRWLVSELANTWKSATEFENATGLNEDWLAWALDFQGQHKVPPKDLYRIFQRKKRWDVPDVKATKLGLALVEKMAYLIMNGKGDIDRWDHWGITANGRLVCIDLGADADEY